MSPSVAIMQPYVFPYLGYFCLVDASDVFVFYDDVHFIQKGWIHRNRIALQGQAHTFSIPLAQRSQNVLIADTQTHDFPAFRSKFIKQLEQGYRKASHFRQGMAYVLDVLEPPHDSIADLAARSVEQACRLMGLSRRFARSSHAFADSRGMARAQRLIHITRQLGATDYVNATGGRTLYEPADFAEHGVRLRFVDPQLPDYPQFADQTFVPNLSVIDAFMHNPASTVRDMVQSYELN